jgi:hypothetical protein
LVYSLGGSMDADEQDVSRLSELRVSARGWHGVQLAVLGFIGLCGVLEDGAGNDGPHWLRVLAGLLVLAAFGLACAATVLVALAAWPTYGPGSSAESASLAVARTSRRLRAGIILTFVAVAALAFATSSAWWPGAAPSGADATAVRVSTRAGEICGAVGKPSRDGVLAVAADGRLVELALADIVAITPVPRCS